MLIEFRFKNYRSFRDEAVLSMEATGLSSFKKSLIPLSSTTKLLPAIAIYGKMAVAKQCDPGFLVGRTIYPQCPTDAA